MAKKKVIKEILWRMEPVESNYPSAMSYLSLLFDEKTAEKFVDKLQSTEISKFKARDIFRASGLPLLGISQRQIEKNHRRIEKGERLSPILLVRDTAYRKVIIADGYHRMCAVYHYNSDSIIPCKII